MVQGSIDHFHYHYDDEEIEMLTLKRYFTDRKGEKAVQVFQCAWVNSQIHNGGELEGKAACVNYGMLAEDVTQGFGQFDLTGTDRAYVVNEQGNTVETIRAPNQF